MFWRCFSLWGECESDNVLVSWGNKHTHKIVSQSNKHHEYLVRRLKVIGAGEGVVNGEEGSFGIGWSEKASLRRWHLSSHSRNMEENSEKNMERNVNYRISS